MVLNVPEVDRLAEALVLVDVAHKSKEIGVVHNTLLVSLEVQHVDSIESI